ncbi:MAG: hypothetical protein FKY71_10480 [Spiribacter salinus]|uniref:DUF3405 domain-containing protein n=1 Tax=Spiribacter salinus TaxID=1335746 RepID=A0A540VQN4_9GAMM|nr:MAG: hypothetical protein FKY71_10480 [Spiribacter salinus]
MCQQVLLFAVHELSAQTVDAFRALCASVPTSFRVILFFDAERIKERDAREVGGQNVLPRHESDWRAYKKVSPYFRRAIPGNWDGHLIKAGAQVGNWRFLWYMEYDVRFSGDWSYFFGAMDSSDADLLTTTIIRRTNIPDWPLWKSLQPPSGVEMPAWNGTLRAFMPLMRISAEGLRCVREDYDRGWTGHLECVLPTVIYQNRLSLEDLGGHGEFVREEHRGRFYRNTPENNWLSPGTFVFQPKLRQMGSEENMLWHPVKDSGMRGWYERDTQSAGSRVVARIRRAAAQLLK